MRFVIDDGVDGPSSVRYVGIATRDVDNTFKAAKGHHGTLVTMDYEAAIMHGLITGASSFSSNGDYIAGGAVSDFPVHEAGAVNISLTGVQMSIVSSSASDTAAGTGARAISIGYIENGTLAAKSETVILNGTTPVLTVATNIRFINSMTMISAGSGGKNAGSITATNGGLTYGAMSIGHRVQASAYRMVPTGKVFVPHEIIASSNSGAAAAQAIFHIVNWSPTIPFWLPSNAVGCQDGPIVIPLKAGRPITAGSIIGVEVTIDKAAHVTASIIGHLENAI